MIDNSMDSDKQKLLGYDVLCVLRRGSRGGRRGVGGRWVGWCVGRVAGADRMFLLLGTCCLHLCFFRNCLAAFKDNTFVNRSIKQTLL